MAVIETKFAVGDVVYCADLVTTKKQRDCPDCLGEKTWTATSPAGRQMKFACPRCCSRYASHQEVSLNYNVYSASVLRRTIGSVQLDTNSEHQVRYMCFETGVGSGRVYYEADLFVTEQEARAAAEAKAEKETSKQPWMVEQFNRSLDISDYQLSDAVMKNARDYEISTKVKVGMLFDDLRECTTIEEVRERLDAGF